MQEIFETRIRTARAVELAKSTIAEIKEALPKYLATPGQYGKDLYAEQMRELGWWEDELKRLAA